MVMFGCRKITSLEIIKRIVLFGIGQWGKKKQGQKYTKAGVRTMQQINNFEASGLLFSPAAIKGPYGSAV